LEHASASFLGLYQNLVCTAHMCAYPSVEYYNDRIEIESMPMHYHFRNQLEHSTMIECVLATYIKPSFFSSKRILLCTKSSNFCKLMFEQILAQDTHVLPIHLTYLQAVLLTGTVWYMHRYRVLRTIRSSPSQK